MVCDGAAGLLELKGMNDEQHRFLMLSGQLPARLTMEQTAWMLNCQPHDIPVLMAARLLKPLGNPTQSGSKFFATADIIEISKDRAWLVKMTNSTIQHWQRKNASRKDGQSALPAREAKGQTQWSASGTAP
jgi:hypothetical protein